MTIKLERHEPVKREPVSSVPCPRCKGGAVNRANGGALWWQVRSARCSWCHGTGRVREETK